MFGFDPPPKRNGEGSSKKTREEALEEIKKMREQRSDQKKALKASQKLQVRILCGSSRHSLRVCECVICTHHYHSLSPSIVILQSQ